MSESQQKIDDWNTLKTIAERWGVWEEVDGGKTYEQLSESERQAAWNQILEKLTRPDREIGGI